MMTYLKRRFSSSDLQEDDGSTDANMQNQLMNFLGLSNNGVLTPQQQQQQQQMGMQQQIGAGGNFIRQQPGNMTPSMSNIPPATLQNASSMSSQQGFGAQKRTTYTSAPASPTKTTSSLSFNTISSQISNTIKSSLFSATQQTYGKCKVLLIIDEPSTDWSKYFRGRRLMNDFEIRVEQATFSELSIASFSEQGAIAEVTQYRDGQRVSRSFKPDYVLVRQHVRDGVENWKDSVIALQYGGVPGVNSLNSVYNFQDKPWVFAQLIGIQQRLGHDQFPLIEQAYYPSFKDMDRHKKRRERGEKDSSLLDINDSMKSMMAPRFPLVVKVSHAHGGAGKLRVETPADLQEISSLVGLSRAYATTEQFVDAKYDIRIQKIGVNYKAFIRKSISGNWKANIGANVLEKVPMNERFKMWIDECSQIFGGLDICAVEMVQGKDGQPHIIEVSGSSMPLLGETQEEDRRLIADLVYAKMQHFFGKSSATVPKATSLHQVHGLHMGMEGTQSPMPMQMQTQSQQHAQAHSQAQQQQHQQQQSHMQMQSHTPMQGQTQAARATDRSGMTSNGQVPHGSSMHAHNTAPTTQSQTMQSQPKQLPSGTSMSTGNASMMGMGPSQPQTQSQSHQPQPQSQPQPYPPTNPYSPYVSSGTGAATGSGLPTAPTRGSSVPSTASSVSGATSTSGAHGPSKPTQGQQIPSSGSGANLSNNLVQQPSARNSVSPVPTTGASTGAGYMPGSNTQSHTAQHTTGPAGSTIGSSTMNRFGPSTTGSQPMPPNRPPFTQSQSVTQPTNNPFGAPQQPAFTQQRALPNAGAGAPLPPQAQHHYGPGNPMNPMGANANANKQEEDDTMNNLRKTFAGIFGDM